MDRRLQRRRTTFLAWLSVSTAVPSRGARAGL